MHVFELTRPGTWLNNLPDEVSHNVKGLLHLLESALADAAMSLALFEAEQAASAARHAQYRQEWDENHAVEAALVAQYETELSPDLSPSERWRLHDEIRERARIEAKRARWRSGHLPDAYAHRLVFLHAKSCLYALDTIGKAIKSLTRVPGMPVGIAQAQANFEAHFPTLMHVRDSAHHPEDRTRGVRGRPGGGETPIVTQPILDGAIHAPSGGVIVLDMLNHNRFGATLADGTYGEVEISKATVACAQEIIQQILNVFSWQGPRQHMPT